MRFNDRQLQTVENCLRVAAERFKENAATIRKESAERTPAGFPSPLARLAEQFDRQQREAEELAHLMNAAEADGEYFSPPPPPGMRRRRGVEYGCGAADCAMCYEPKNAPL